MALVLTIQAQLMCPHGGAASAVTLQGTPTRKVSGVNILCENHTGSVAFACMNSPACTAVTTWMANQTAMKIDGSLVLTDESVPVTNNGPGRVVSPGQAKLQIG